MNYEYILYEEQGPITIIRLNRPERRNAFNPEMTSELDLAWDRFEDDEKAEVAILTGTGKTFCSGVDWKNAVKWSNLTKEEREKLKMTRRKQERKGAINGAKRMGLGKPYITAINGHALGLGVFVAMGADMVVAAESAVFIELEARRSLTGGGAMMANQMIPFHIAMEMAMGIPVTARRAYEIGLVNRVVPDDQLIPTAIELAQAILETAPLAREYTITGIRNCRLSRAIPSLTALSQFQDVHVLPGTEDFREAFRAAYERRKPVWQGH